MPTRFPRFSFDELAPLLLVLPLLVPAAGAQEKSVNPGINAPYEKDPDPKKFVASFEVESREVFNLRKQIVAACRLKPGMAVADVGAGTGLFTRLFAAEVARAGPSMRPTSPQASSNISRPPAKTPESRMSRRYSPKSIPANCRRPRSTWSFSATSITTSSFPRKRWPRSTPP